MSKLSMGQIAKELGISPAYLSYMLNGEAMAEGSVPALHGGC